MTETAMRQKVAEALQHEQTTRTFARRLEGLVSAGSLPIPFDALPSVVGCIRAYVEGVPILLEAATAAAQRAGAQRPLQPLFDAAVAYFHDPNDLIPDSLGLLGVLDDAYLALALVSAASQRCFDVAGRHLIDFPPALIQAHRDVGVLLGPVGVRLDEFVTTTVIKLFPQVLAQLAQLAQPLQPEVPRFYSTPQSSFNPNEYADLMVKAVTGG